MRLEVSRRSDLATRALLGLAALGRRTKAPELAERIGTSRGFLGQVMAPLVDRRWVTSDPGPTGGYALVADLTEVSVLDVVEAVEGPTDTGRCVLADRPCTEHGLCALHVPWTRARERLLEELGGVTLASAARATPDHTPEHSRRR